MKQICLILVTGIATVGCVMADDAKEPVSKRPVALVKAVAVDDALVERVRTWVKDSLAVEMPLLDPIEQGDESLDKVGLKAAKQLRPGDLGVVVLAMPGADRTEHGVSMIEDRVVVVNVQAMRAEDASDEAFSRRVERQVMRGIGLLTGMDTCPNGTCALYRYQNLKELDEMGRNFCPPCAQRYQESMQRQGIPIDSSSPFFMLREALPQP